MKGKAYCVNLPSTASSYWSISDVCDNVDVEDLDLKKLEEEGEPPSPKAHNRECRRNRSRKTLFQDFKPGDAVLVHLQGKPGRHLVCQVAQLNAKRYTLQCKRAT